MYINDWLITPPPPDSNLLVNFNYDKLFSYFSHRCGTTHLQEKSEEPVKKMKVK